MQLGPQMYDGRRPPREAGMTPTRPTVPGSPTAQRFAPVPMAAAMPEKPTQTSLYGMPRRVLVRGGQRFIPVTKETFLFSGLILLVLVSVLPAWDCASLLLSPTYAIFGNRQLPMLILAASAAVVLVFYLATVMLVGRSESEQRSGQTMSMISSLSLTLLGLVLVLVSLPMMRAAMETHNSIMYQCGNSLETRELRDRYLELLKLRQEPACAAKYSIERCEGFQDDMGYTAYLQAMEGNFRCSGFCFRGSMMLGKAGTNASKATAAKVPRPMALRQQARRGKVVEATKLEAASAARDFADAARGEHIVGLAAMNVVRSTGSSYPPTLFSDANFKASCDGAAARNIMDTAFASGSQMWYTGVMLIAFSLCTGVWEWSCRSEA